MNSYIQYFFYRIRGKQAELSPDGKPLLAIPEMSQEHCRPLGDWGGVGESSLTR